MEENDDLDKNESMIALLHLTVVLNKYFFWQEIMKLKHLYLQLPYKIYKNFIMQSSFETYGYNLISDATFKMPHSHKQKKNRYL